LEFFLAAQTGAATRSAASSQAMRLLPVVVLVVVTVFVVEVIVLVFVFFVVLFVVVHQLELNGVGTGHGDIGAALFTGQLIAFVEFIFFDV